MKISGDVNTALHTHDDNHSNHDSIAWYQEACYAIISLMEMISYHQPLTMDIVERSQ